MMRFEYKVLQCSGPDLEAKLNELGNEGWRLHTCDPFYTQGEGESLTTHFTVVLDRGYMLDESSDNPGSDTIDRPEAIACKN